MIKHIATSCLAAMVLHPTAWAQETSPVDTPDVPTEEQIPPAPVDVQTEPNPSHGSLKHDGFYVGGSIGPVFFKDNSIEDFDIDYDTGTQISGLAGVRFGILRTELELGSQYVEFDPSNSIFDGDVDIFRATVNAYLDVVTVDVGWLKGGMTPYIGGGLGIAVADIEGFNDSDTGFTTNAEAGVMLPIVRKVDIFPAYRFEWTDFDEFDDSQKAHVVRVGARYRF